ncbi:MAG: DUF930 domain-containing protein [Mesorhizobium sp.]|uniref:DUF930 domain-containing protein n=1 Tax=Mesorhizobium sp. TaxID=1871066 RepID=UPI001224C2C9|nr:DUF930 domain-containing protein [Mesorhizobium sp.]TIO54014.1 MAG: DUF930 domain-containing protein [Mesorhizobium sp.]TIO57759.1 MAG: DUF930 domain-containing protein [Mesorhizobium sp.]TJV60094.1 MAG: DUF930 domain-containing protein [Mesorhizobium sp.]
MKGETEERRWNLAWALPASLILHALIAAFLVYSLPRPAQQPDQEQPVNVALVPPPEQPKPKPPPTPQPKAEKPPEPKAEKPPLLEKQPPKPPAIAVLKPVFQYGDKDTGPRESLDGGGDRDNTPSPAKDNDSKPPAVPKAAQNQSAAPADADQRADPSKADDKPVTAATDAKPTQSEEKQTAQDTDKQQADKQDAGAQTAEKAVAPTPLGAESDGKVELPATAEKPKPKPANALKFRPARVSKSRSRGAGTPSSTNAAVAGSPIYSGLPGVRKLYSQGATGDALATSSMSGVPRDQRVANLCGSVLNQELQEASYSPKWLPSIPLKVGNVLAPPEAAFSTATTWYRLGFRCEVDAEATRVLSFNFRVGAEIPRGEWARLRLPSLH